MIPATARCTMIVAMTHTAMTPMYRQLLTGSPPASFFMRIAG